MKYEEYLVKKGKTDLLSSIKLLDKNLVNKKMKEFGVDNIYELKEYIIDSFEMCLDMSKEDIMTQLYFQRLLENENSEWMSAYQDDIESLWVYVYENSKHYSYYIPTEIKDIIKRLLGSMSEEEKFNLENAADTPIIKDLKGLLDSLRVKDLRNIGELFLINRLSNKPKKELVNVIYSALVNEKTLIGVIERFIDKEFNLLKELMNNKGTIQDNNISAEKYHFLYMLGIVFIFKRNNKFYVSMTDDVYNVIRKMDLNKFEKIIDENTKAYNLVRAIVELYGAISCGELDYYYSLYYGNKEELDNPDNALFFCERLDNIAKIYSENNLYFVNRILVNPKFESIFNDIVERQKEVKRKPIKLDELLKYDDYSYYEETDSKNSFKKYLKRKNISNDAIEEIMSIISQMYRLGSLFVGVSIEMLQEYGLEVTEKNIQEVIEYLNAIYNNTRIWTNNGWTPIEMRKDYKTTI